MIIEFIFLFNDDFLKYKNSFVKKEATGDIGNLLHSVKVEKSENIDDEEMFRFFRLIAILI